MAGEECRHGGRAGVDEVWKCRWAEERVPSGGVVAGKG